MLYVEDNPANLMLVEDLISRRPDVRLLTAEDGLSGIEIARASLPAVILMDINLPGISGIQALGMLAEDSATAIGPDGDDPVVLLHGWADTADTFQFLVDAFERDWPLAAFDWRGFGRSGWQPLRSLVRAGVPVALGSDGPINPFVNIMFAVLHPVNPAEALTVEEAVIAYTRGSAYAQFAESEKGTLQPGRMADLAVLSQDIFEIAPDQLPATTSLLTLVGGSIAHARPPFSMR